MSKTEAVQKAMMQALKDKDAARKETLSLLLSALKAKAKDKREPLTAMEEDTIVLKEIKQTEETMTTAPDSRTDIIEKCKARIAVLREFAPQMMGEAEIDSVIDTVLQELEIEQPTGKQKGLIMKNLMPRVKGKADSALVNQLLSKRMV
ncbi:GatB/YqeY domain-containing protein [Christensenellaceae bacterium NSJ-44]|uniref:GatB/YqeY domain-containing protein n=1 Tax=Luoshenia tenuis TaxID=2763654 RepID=A0A926D073_9FIRM|nr:GatB/YqeY domain-containing protein [Luoshenia tenuis]MBC8528976.1 GatB/YqeY domain-containing protein [Luoshenia tenuis]